MNADEAKVPDLKGDWQSIEIFLFSNGQQYSPPRKYHLRADELNFWDNTLNLLAQSHYGLQSPPINLYTTDGRLVEGPLELKDGLAYVAVTSPDPFIDAGYQKYLIRACRSWEKRQARKRIPECVLEEICCLCPEKDECCDLQMCCLCPEKEDEDYLESLSVTGHPELGPAGRPFMSSVFSKPAVADDYRPKSAKIASSAGEHAVRPGEYGASQDEFGYPPVESLAKPAGYGAKLVEYEASPNEHALRLSENASRLGEFRTTPDEYGAKLNENAMRPGEYEAYSGEFRLRPDENVPIASKNGVVCAIEYKARPGENGAKLIEYKAKLGEYEVKASEYESRPTVNGAMPGNHKARPGENETRRSVNGAKPGEYRARLGEFADRSVEQRTRPRPGKGGAWSDEDGVRPTVYEARPVNDGPWPNEIESKKEAYEIELRDNERSLDDDIERSDKDTVDKDTSREDCKFHKQSSTLSPIDESNLEKKGEYRVTEGDQRDYQIDLKGRVSGNEGRVVRRENDGEQSGRENDTVNRISKPRAIQNENARRPSELRPPGIENKYIPSQQKGGIEQNKTRRLSGQAGEQKGRETNPAGRAGLNAARLSDQRNKQSDHLARLGGRESRVGDHEARAGDLGIRSSDHEAGLVTPGSRVADPGARGAVSGSRASPRDRMSFIARTSNLVQPKLGPPGTRVYETAAKLDESEIKNRVGYPGARQSGVAGTGAAGASHISEAQQHARRSSLSARTASTEKKRLSIGQNTSLLRKPTPISSVLHKSEDKQPVKNNKDILPRRMTAKASAIPVPASNDLGKSKTLPKDPYKHITPPALETPTISITNLVNLATNKSPLENVIDEKEINENESEIRSMRLDSVKIIVDVSKNSPKETQTELIYDKKTKVSGTVNKEVQTNTEAIEHHQQEVSTSSTAKVNSYTSTCALCCKRHHRLATVDPDENIISIQNKGDVFHLKLKIEVRNIVRSVYSCQKNCLKSRSLTNITSSEKESQISIDDGVFVRRKRSLQSIINQQCFQDYGFESSPQLMVVQCAGCGRLNYPPRCDLPPCCDNNKKYFVLLSNSLTEDMDEDMDCCNFNPPCRPCGLRQSQEKKTSRGVPIKQTLSEMTLDTITTVTVSGVPLQRREIGKKIDTTCQTEEPQSECMMTTRKVSISEDSGTRCDSQKETSSSILVTTQVKQSRKLCSLKCEHEDSQVCSEFCPPVMSCKKVQSVCSEVISQTSPQVQTLGCMPVSPTCLTCPKPLPFIQIQTQVCPQLPQVSDAQTQTQWNCVVLLARLHPDGRYSFHLPPLKLFKSYPF